MNTIPSRQNEPRAIERLAAQRRQYGRAKTYFATSLFLALPVSVGMAFASAAVADLKPYAAALGMAVTLANLFLLDRQQKSLAREAATIQEEFDCSLFELDWNALKVGARPLAEDIVALASECKQIDKLRDWYPKNVGRLQLGAARLICQRANCTWERGLRRRLAVVVVGVMIVLAISVTAAGLVGDFSLSGFLMAVVAPLMPAITLGTRQVLEHLDAARSSERLARHAEDLLKKAVAGDSSATSPEASRALQDEIFDRRRSAPLIFDWVYNRMRTSHDDQMNKAAQQWVDHLLARSGRPA